MIAFLARGFCATLLLIVLAVILASCADTRTIDYRDVSGQGRQQSALEADVAACRYEFELARAGSGQYNFKSGVGGRFGLASDQVATALLSAPPRALYDACLEARGWREVR